MTMSKIIHHSPLTASDNAAAHDARGAEPRGLPELSAFTTDKKGQTAMPAPFVCTECTYPSRLTDCCDNPGCLANPRANHEALRAMKAETEKRRAEEEARKAFRASLRRSGFTPAL